MADESTPPGRTRQSFPTPYIEHDEALVMVAPSSLTRVACIDAAVELELRPVLASQETAARVVATVRPLVVVAERTGGLKGSDLTDLAVSVGAQLVMVEATDVGPALAERIKLSGRAAQALRKRASR